VCEEEATEYVTRLTLIRTWGGRGPLFHPKKRHHSGREKSGQFEKGRRGGGKEQWRSCWGEPYLLPLGNRGGGRGPPRGGGEGIEALWSIALPVTTYASSDKAK